MQESTKKQFLQYSTWIKTQSSARINYCMPYLQNPYLQFVMLHWCLGNKLCRWHKTIPNMHKHSWCNIFTWSLLSLFEKEKTFSWFDDNYMEGDRENHSPNAPLHPPPPLSPPFIKVSGRCNFLKKAVIGGVGLEIFSGNGGGGTSLSPKIPTLAVLSVVLFL